MPRKAELVTAGLAIVIHAGLGLMVARAGKSPPPPRPKPVLLQFERRPETPPAPPAPAAPPAVHPPSARKVAMRAPHPAAARPPAETRASAPPAARPAAPPAPAYAVAMTSTMQVAAVAVPRGVPGSGAGRGPGAPGAAASARDGAGDGYRPVSAREVGSMPEVDAEACGRAAVYPREAEQSGTEGDVRLRVSLNERGQVHAVRVLSGLGRGLDAAAIDAIKNRCRFKPAIGRDGQPVAFVIESYRFHFELPR